MFEEFRDGCSKIVSEYDQEIPQSQTADNPVAFRWTLFDILME